MATEQRIQVRRGTRSEWTSEDPTLSNGEPGFDTTNVNLKVGDGSAAFSALQSVVPAGIVLPFAGATGNTPDGFLACDGSAISRSSYSELFAAIGTTWGSGDGSTTFNLPDLRGAFLRGAGAHGSETMANGDPFAGPAVGAFEDDRMQGHYHDQWLRQNAFGTGSASAAGTIADFEDAVDNIRDAKTDGTNGPPRVGPETRPFSAGVNWIIKAY